MMGYVSWHLSKKIVLNKDGEQFNSHKQAKVSFVTPRLTN
jgi:hypothetical protein